MHITSCDRVVRHLIGVSETSGLIGHVRNCRGSDKQLHLDGFGITGGHPTRYTREQVREWFALWIAESARVHSIVEDRYVGDSILHVSYDSYSTVQLHKLLHPDARAHIPHRDTVSQDVKRIYEAVQIDIIALLAVSNCTSQVYLLSSNLNLEASRMLSHCAGPVSKWKRVRFPRYYYFLPLSCTRLISHNQTLSDRMLKVSSTKLFPLNIY